MSDLLEKASSWLADQRRRHLSQMAVYSRGGDSVQIAATIGSTMFEVADEYGVIEKWESRDFLIAAADLVLGGVTVTPQRGDRITASDPSTGSGQGKVYEVLAPGKEHVYRPADPYSKTLRIYTKQVE